jgi:hypothetical protein
MNKRLEYQPFGIVLRDLLIERGITTRLHNPHWAQFARSVPGVHYETLRKAITGEREPAIKLIEAVAKALNVAPTLFAEYRLARARESLNPARVPLREALEFLARIESSS